MNIQSLFCAALSLAVAGCHLGGAAVEGVVVAPGDPVKSAVLGPIDGATIAIRCPGPKDRPALRASTNGQGLFKISIEERFSRACTIDVEKPGFESVRIDLGQVCPRHEDNPAAEYCGLETIVVVQLHESSASALSKPR
jgi:hypothetical protein